MNSIARLIRREPNVITGVVTAVYGVLQVFDIVNWTDAQTGAVTVLLGALMLAVRQLVTPTAN